MNEIHSLMHQVRDLINISWKNYELRQDKSKFSQLCSSIDVIEDTSDAIEAFSSQKFDSKNTVLYLIIFGVLQALIVQQDAVFNLCEVLDINKSIEDFPKLKEIREIRNNSIGHPTKRTVSKQKNKSFNYIIQASMSQNGFELITIDEKGEISCTCIDLQKEISEQTTIISKILEETINKLKNEEKIHREEFTNEKLADFFPETVHYYYEKLIEVLKSGETPEFGLMNLNILLEPIDRFVQSLQKRNMDSFDLIKDDYELMKYAQKRISDYLNLLMNENISRTSTDKLNMIILARFLYTLIKKWTEYAKEIDAEYSIEQ